MTTDCPVIDKPKSIFMTSLEANIAFAILVIILFYIFHKVKL